MYHSDNPMQYGKYKFNDKCVLIFCKLRIVLVKNAEIMMKCFFYILNLI